MEQQIRKIFRHGGASRARVEAATAVYVSVASVWEVALKHALGKIDGDPRAFKTAISGFGFEELTIQSGHVIATVALPAIHNDPFDRPRIAQAISEPLQLITSDALCLSTVSWWLWFRRRSPRTRIMLRPDSRCLAPCPQK